MIRGSRSNRACLWLLGALVLGALCPAWGKDFWDVKHYSQWDQKEAVALLSQSPWATTQTVLGAILLAKPPEDHRAGDLPRPVTPGTPSTANLFNAGVNFGATDSVPLFVRWASSKRIRQAWGRLAQIQGGPFDTERYAS